MFSFEILILTLVCIILISLTIVFKELDSFNKSKTIERILNSAEQNSLDPLAFSSIYVCLFFNVEDKFDSIWVDYIENSFSNQKIYIIYKTSFS